MKKAFEGTSSRNVFKSELGTILGLPGRLWSLFDASLAPLGCSGDGLGRSRSAVGTLLGTLWARLGGAEGAPGDSQAPRGLSQRSGDRFWEDLGVIRRRLGDDLRCLCRSCSIQWCTFHKKTTTTTPTTTSTTATI